MELVSNLILNSSQYTAGAQQAIGSNRAISGSIDSIIGQLQRQRTAFERSNLTTRDNILASAGKGATEGQVNVALQLNEEVDAHRRNAIAAQEDAMAARAAQEAKDAASRAGSALLVGLQQEIAALGMSAGQLQIYRAGQQGVKQVVLDAAAALQAKRDALIAEQQAQAAADAEVQRGVLAGQELVASLRASAAAHGMSATQARVYEAAQAGASRSDVEAAMALAARERIQRRQDAAVAAATAQTQQANAALIQSKNSSQGLTIAIQGVEDAASGFANNGLKGMIVGCTNNINQLSTLADKSIAWKMQLGATAALIGVSLIPMLYKWATASEEVADRQKDIAEAATKRHDVAMTQIEREYDYRLAREKEVRGLRDAVKGERSTEGNLNPKGPESAAELRRREQDIVIKQTEAMNVRAREQDRLNRMRDRRESLIADTAGMILTEKDEGYDVYKDKRDEIKKIEAEEIRSRQLIAEADRDYRDGEQDKAAIRAAREKRETEERIREQNRVNQLMKENEREAQEEIDAQRKEGEQKRLEAQRSFASMLSSSAAQLDPKAGERRELEEKRRQIERAQKQGVISEAEAASLKSTIIAKPDPVSGSAAAVQAGTREAYSSIVRAMRGAEQAKEIERQRKLAESQLAVLERIETAIREQEELQVVETPI